VVARIVPGTNRADLSGVGPIGALTRAQLMRSMKVPPSLKLGIWGAVIGAAIISVLVDKIIQMIPSALWDFCEVSPCYEGNKRQICYTRFSLFGWTLDSAADQMAKERALTAVVEVFAPICAERFQQQADAPAKLKEARIGCLASPIPYGGMWWHRRSHRQFPTPRRCGQPT
jgi:hypothetical protein